MYLTISIIVILSAIALWLFQYMNQRRKIRQEEMHDRKRQQFGELLKLVSHKDEAGEHPPTSPRDSLGNTRATETGKGSES